MKQLQSLVGKPYERQPRESGEAFEAFLAYRGLGLERSQSQVGRQLKKSYQLISRWARAYLWDERARAYDNMLDREVQNAEKKERKAVAERFITQARLMQSRGLEGLMAMQATILDAHGKAHSRIKPRDCVALIKTGIDIEKLFYGDPKQEPIDRVEIVIEETKPAEEVA